MRTKVYVETSVISYLVAGRNQRDVLVASNQELTREWWETRRHRFDLCVSAVVLAEAARGDQIYAAARLAVVRELTLVEISEEAMALAKHFGNGQGFRRARTKTRFTSRSQRPRAWTTCSPGIAGTSRMA